MAEFKSQVMETVLILTVFLKMPDDVPDLYTRLPVTSLYISAARDGLFQLQVGRAEPVKRKGN